MSKLEDELKKEFDLFYENPEKYRTKVDDISSKFGNRFKNDYLPTYIVGNYKDNNEKYVLISLNPGFVEDQSREEEKLKNKNFDEYMNFAWNYFKICQNLTYYDNSKQKNRKFNANYYNFFRDYLATLLDETITTEKMYDVCHKHLLNIDIVPYPSSRFKFTFNDSLKEYLKERMDSILDFLSLQKNIKGAIFNGSQYLEIIKNLYPETIFETTIVEVERESKGTNDHFVVNLFTLNGVKCIQHNYLNNQKDHLSNEEKKKIANEFLKYINHKC